MDKPRKLAHLPQRLPVNATFELTIRCNLRCKMCLFRHGDDENIEIIRNELSTDQWIDLARQAAEIGTLSILVTGGEPMLRPDFCDIWEGIYQKGFLLTLYTNATMVTPKIMDTLKKYPPHKIGVTIYGAGPDTYERVTGSAEAFERMIKGVKQLRELPSQIYYRTTVIKDNLEDLDKIEDLIREQFDPDPDYSVAQNIYRPVRGGNADVDSCRIAAEDQFRVSFGRALYELKTKVGERFEKGRVELQWNDDVLKDRAPAKEAEYSLFGCHAGMKSYTVSWDGKLLGCQLLGNFSEEIKGDLRTAWERFPKNVKLPPFNEECRGCSLNSKCAICPAVLFAETGAFDKKPEYICRYTHAREEFIRKIKNGEVRYEKLQKA